MTATTTVRLDYFYGTEDKMCSFYRIPKAFEKNEAYRNISLEVKYLYCIMLDRVSLSTRNDWKEEGRVFIYFTLDDVSKYVNVGRNKAVRVIREMEQLGLIERRKQGQGKPARIFVKNIIETKPEPVLLPENHSTTEAVLSAMSERETRAEDSLPIPEVSDISAVSKSVHTPVYAENTAFVADTVSVSAAVTDTMSVPAAVQTDANSLLSASVCASAEDSASSSLSSLLEDTFSASAHSQEQEEEVSSTEDDIALSFMPEDSSPDDTLDGELSGLFHVGVSRLPWNQDSELDFSAVLDSVEEAVNRYASAASDTFQDGPDSTPDSPDFGAADPDISGPTGIGTGPQTSQNQTSGSPKSGSLDFPEWDSNYNLNKKYNDSIYTQSIYPDPPEDFGEPDGWEEHPRWTRWMDKDGYREHVKANIDYDILAAEHAGSLKQIDEYVELMVDTCCSTRKTFRVNSEEHPVQEIRNRFEELNQMHIMYVLDCMENLTTRVRNIRAYTLTALFNASKTMESYYNAMIERDERESERHTYPKTRRYY